MPSLNTPQDVIQAFGVARLADYFGIEPLIGGAGFSVRRRYAPDTPPSRVVTAKGDSYAVCVIQIYVAPPKTPNGISRLQGDAWLYERCQERHRLFFAGHNFADPECPTEGTFYAFDAAPKPQRVNLTAEFFYDCGDGHFYGPQDQLSGQEILALLYNAHCKTLGFTARLMFWFSSTWRNMVRRLVWGGQDVCLWLLEYGYDIKPTPDKSRPLNAPFRIFKWSDFIRTSDEKGTHFFGFQTSRRSFFSNLILLALAVVGAYSLFPRNGLVRAIYMNTPLSTVALIFAFLLADQLAPRLLQGAVWGLCRLRLKALFF